MAAPTIPWNQLEKVLRRDPARRGLVSGDVPLPPLLQGHFRLSAESLAQASCVGIVTGYCVADLPEPAAETDGPPGALYLARALDACGIDAELISDTFGRPLLECGMECWGIDFPLHELPLTDLSEAWIGEFFAQQPFSHLVAIERPGPSHTLESLARQSRSGPVPGDEFGRRVPESARDRCHNMRGICIDSVTAPAHELFEYVASHQLPVITIGIGDGGNEIGMGSLPWEYLCQAILTGPAERIACRVATDYTLLAGVSNWGGYALGLAVAGLCDQIDVAQDWNTEDQRKLISALVEEAGAVDGVTRLREATVDGLPLETYLQALASMRRHFDLKP